MFYVEMLDVNARHVDGFLSTEATPINRIRASACGCGQRPDAVAYIIYNAADGTAQSTEPVSIW